MLEEIEARDFIDDAKKLMNIDTDELFAEKIGEKKGTVDKWIQRKKIPLAKKIRIDQIIDWELKEQYAEDYHQNKTRCLIDKDRAQSFPTPSNIIKIPIIEAKASAGTGIHHFDVETSGELLIDQMLFKVLPTLKNVRAIAVSGDSMTPTLQDGDYVVIEESVRFSGDGIYVLQYDGVLLVKRLQADLDGIEILSDNQKYKARTYNPNDDQRSFHIIGKVILRIQR